MKLTVVHLEGGKQGQTEHLAGPVIQVGRDPSCPLSFDPEQDLDVSGRHASITFQGDQVMLQDLGSRNGTLLNGAEIEGAVPVPNESIVQFGKGGPKVKLTFVTGPGKKTQQIDDLSSQLEDKDRERTRAARQGRTYVACLIVLAILVTGGLITYAVSSAQYEDYHRVVDEGGLEDEAAAARERAREEDPQEWEESAASWEEAESARSRAEEAAGEADYETAVAAYEEAIAAYEAAAVQAGDAKVAALSERLDAMETESERLAEEAAAARRARDEEIRAAVAEAEEEAEEKVTALKERLEEADDDAGGLLEELSGLERSTNPGELEEGIAAIEEHLAESPDDPQKAELQGLREELADRLAELNDVEDLLDAAAKKAKQEIVAVRTHVFAIPGDQKLDTTKIRITVARGRGTGLFVSPSGHVATAKEALAPHLFEGQALALHTKLAEKGMRFFTEVELYTSAPGGVYTPAYGAMFVATEEEPYAVAGPDEGAPERDGPPVRVVRVLETEAGKERTVTIPFDNVQARVAVAPQERGAGNLAILQVEGAEDPHLELAPDDPTEGAPLVALGTQQGGPELEKDQVGLYLFQGKVELARDRLLLDCPSYPSWAGGPILDPEGRVLGLVVKTGSENSWAAPVSAVRGALQKD